MNKYRCTKLDFLPEGKKMIRTQRVLHSKYRRKV